MTEESRKAEDGAEVGRQEVVEGEVVAIEPTSPPTAADLGIDLPEDRQSAEDLLLTRLGEAREEASSYLDDLKRVAADFDNFRRRTLREQAETSQRATERILLELLPVLDSFDAAMAVEASTDSEEKLLAGMHRTHDQLLTILANQGVEVVPTVGEPFNPEIHEAVMSPSDGEGKLVVSQELRRGYTVKGRLARPALVALEYES
ncbi:MAG: nucleotide exchange factor GrpE [Acidimicrobiia bacterium]